MPWRTSLVTNGRRIDDALRLGNARARVAHDRPARRPSAERHVDRDLAVGRRRVQRVRDEVRDDLQDAVAVAAARRASPSAFTCSLTLARRGPPRAARRPHARRRRARSTSSTLSENLRVSSRARSSRSPISRCRRAGLGEHDLERRLLLLLAVDDAVRDRLDVPLDGRQRRAQLVRDAHQEVALVLARLLELARHLLEAQRELAELVGALRGQVHVVVAARDALARLGQLAHRTRDAAAEQQRDERRGGHGQQQRQARRGGPARASTR